MIVLIAGASHTGKTACTIETVLRDSRRTLEGCQRAGLPYILIDKEYDVDIQL